MTTPLRITGLGSHVPPRIVPNAELEKMLDTTDEWVKQRTGIKERRWADKSKATSDLGAEAGKAALANAKIDAKDCDLLICATISPDHEFPGTACFLQPKVGIPAGVPAIDVRQQCSGFLFGMSVAQQYLSTKTAKRVLLVCSEIHSKCLDLTPRGRDVSVLFGDGAAAVVLEADTPGAKGPLLTDLKIGCDGYQAKVLWCPAPGTGFDSASRYAPFMAEEALQFPKMDGRSVFMNAVRTMSGELKSLCERNKTSLAEIDLFVIHQANRRIADGVADALGVPATKFHNTVWKYGNTTAASVPLGLADAVESGALKPGMKVAIAAFGAGFTFGTALVQW